MKIGDTFMQGKRTYTVIGFDAMGRAVATCDAALIPVTEETPAEETPAEEAPKKRTAKKK